MTTPAPLDLFGSFRHRAPSCLELLRAVRAAAVWGARPQPWSLALRLLAWCTRYPLDVARQMGCHAGRWRRAFGRSLPGQLADILTLGLRNGVMPRDYYRSELAGPRGQGALRRLLPYELYAAPVMEFSLRRGAPSLGIVADKAEFDRFCRSHGLPAPHTFAVFAGETARAGLPHTDLVVKPAVGLQGRGVEVWRFQEPRGFSADGAAWLSPEALEEHCRARGRARPGGVLVQERLAGHAEWADLSANALSTCKVVTAMDETGAPEVVVGFYRSAVDPAAPVDNATAGGCFFLVDIESGGLGRGYRSDFSENPVAIEAHPLTGRRMTGAALPGWCGIRALALEAHRALPELPFIGWDVAHCQRGPVLVEANVPPGMTPLQQSALGGLDGTRFMELLAHHARSWLETLPPGSRFRVGAALRTGP